VEEMLTKMDIRADARAESLSIEQFAKTVLGIVQTQNK
jgi:16S rRNA A1518/A1519 N6-dimethyltransferase RsmA/KsgA/DIM1 with predicted DNA glycosylase/AP lyase activity